LNNAHNVKQPVISNQYIESKKDKFNHDFNEININKFQLVDLEDIDMLDIDTNVVTIETPSSLSPTDSKIDLDKLTNSASVRLTGSIFDEENYDLTYKYPKEFTIKITHQARQLLNSSNGKLNGSTIEAYMNSFSNKIKGILFLYISLYIMI
jgi:hypothetical protein